MITKDTIAQYFQSLQDNICKSLEEVDGKGKFIEDKWQREAGGGGKTRIITNGAVIEKGGVAFSAVHGELSKDIADALQLTGKSNFFATGVSIVIHPYSPMVPIIHMNVRYFEVDGGEKWFGGGIDLTPHYVLEDDAQYFHQQLKATCDAYDMAYYPKFKPWADDYFYIKHRDEMRGIGGIFFDRLIADETHTLEQRFAFVQAIGEKFAPIYTHFMSKNKELPFTDAEKKWQYLRRGRYVEFNLAYDRGTHFGFNSGGRTESILMSLPPIVHWDYNVQPQPNTKESRTLANLKKGINWV